MKQYFKKIILTLAMCLMFLPITSLAAASTGEMVQFPGVSLSPDGSARAWTTDLYDKTNERLPRDYTVNMNASSSIANLKAGQHYYDKPAEGSVTIGKWVVSHTPGQCIHDTVTRDTFAGFTYRNEKCLSYYNNGWLAYCADCGEEIAYMFIYAKESTVRGITSVPASSVYVYLCPHCTHLEQGSSYQHQCIGISSNKYRVTYRPNDPKDSSVSGYMGPTMHVYDNSTTYNGQPAAEIGYTDTALRKNSYFCQGYVFAGWNTKADGSGVSFTDGQEVLNLTTQEDGIVKLYAQWVKAESSILLDANGGTYNGQAIYEQKQKYGTTYRVDNNLIVPPAGYKVTFQTNGGAAVASIKTTKSFSHWEKQTSFAGEFKDNIYTFLGANGSKDRLKAWYVNNSFKLPDCTGSNASLVGWFDDPGLSDDSFVGKPGDELIVDKDTVLYAKWATLTLWSYDDYDSRGGVGAVDLKWEQKDGKSKYYRLYQSEDKSTWKQINESSDVGNLSSVNESFGYSGTQGTYKAPYSGLYTLTAYGAQGGSYGSYSGGKGGLVTGRVWLEAGEIITYTIGGQNGYNGGGSATQYGNGGGATSVVSNRQGTLLIAGGGGGASANGNGGSGGATANLRPDNVSSGASGQAGGGGGYVGGKAGEVIVHSHQTSGCAYHTHTGNATSGGACYKTPVVTPQTCYYTDEGWRYEYPYGGCHLCGQGNIREISCHYYGHSACGQEGGHWGETVCGACGGTIAVWGEFLTGSHPYNVTTYALSCSLKEGWQCPYTEGQVVSSNPAYGGSNYVNTGAVSSYTQSAGNRSGNGAFVITSESIGYLDELYLNNVLAKDKAAPGAILSYTEALVGEDTSRIQVASPDDYGTVYYHKAESYEAGTIKKLVDSNITENTLISGVAGYRYFVDGKETGTVTKSHTFTSTGVVDVSMQTTQRYLHIAAVDVAGNIGPTKNIPIPIKDDPDIEIDEEYTKDVPLKTRQMTLEDTDYVYGIGDRTFYVKVDGDTEHVLSVSGYVDGKATNEYQVDYLQMISGSRALSEWYQTRIPRVEITVGDRDFTNMHLTTAASAEDLALLLPTSATAVRSDRAVNVKLTQRIVIDASNDGKPITVYPRALAEVNDSQVVSNEREDKVNGLTLIPDGVAPVITGIDALENAGNIDMTEESKDFVIKATDTGSGLRRLEITIINTDNMMKRTYTSDTGTLTITMTKEDYLFLGDFVVTAEAYDNVGNVAIRESDTIAFALRAELERARFPHNGDFKAGDGAVLTITTGGYAEKVIIRFPDELLALNLGLDKEYVYDFPEAIKTEIYDFNIPLGTPNGNYTIQVEAWKNGLKLTEDLQLPVRTVGSILEELRTRIRDNGV